MLSRGAEMPRTTGRHERSSVGGDEVKVFILEMLPPHDPPLIVEGALAELLGLAERALGRLNLGGRHAAIRETDEDLRRPAWTGLPACPLSP
jgi:hypothetical protein